VGHGRQKLSLGFIRTLYYLHWFFTGYFKIVKTHKMRSEISVVKRHGSWIFFLLTYAITSSAVTTLLTSGGVNESISIKTTTA
jgi:hypothetical protein